MLQGRKVAVIAVGTRHVRAGVAMASVRRIVIVEVTVAHLANQILTDLNRTSPAHIVHVRKVAEDTRAVVAAAIKAAAVEAAVTKVAAAEAVIATTTRVAEAIKVVEAVATRVVAAADIKAAAAEVAVTRSAAVEAEIAILTRAVVRVAVAEDTIRVAAEASKAAGHQIDRCAVYQFILPEFAGHLMDLPDRVVAPAPRPPQGGGGPTRPPASDQYGHVRFLPRKKNVEIWRSAERARRSRMKTAATGN